MNAVGALGYPPEIAALAEILYPGRAGPRPRMPEVLPHIQLDQWPAPEFLHELLEWSVSLPDVTVQQSRMASPDSTALALADECAAGPPEAFIDLAEFCHLHAAPPGGVHLTLPSSIGETAVRLGWAESHPAAKSGSVTPCLIAVYAPRDRRELEAAMALIAASWRFARGRP